MKVIILVSYAFPFIGSGLGQVAGIQGEALVKKGHEVIIISSKIPDSKKRFKKNGVLYIKENANNFLNRFGIPVPIFIFSKETIRHIKTANIVHAHDMLYPQSLFGAILAKIYKKPFVLTQHAGFIVYKSKLINLIQEFAKLTVGNLVLSLSDKIILINEEVKSWLGVQDNRVITLPNGVDTRLFKKVSERKKKQLKNKYKIPLNKNVVLYVGRLVEKKGFNRVYEAKSDDYFTIIAGGGEIPEIMKKDRKNVMFAGNIPQSKLAELYQLSDVFVLPSDCEGFPLSIQEAMATGLPIVSTKHPGFEKYLDGKFVSFINPDSESIKKAVKKIFSNNNLREKMINYSIEKTKERSWDKNVKTLIDIYKSL